MPTNNETLPSSSDGETSTQLPENSTNSSGASTECLGRLLNWVGQCYASG